MPKKKLHNMQYHQLKFRKYFKFTKNNSCEFHDKIVNYFSVIINSLLYSDIKKLFKSSIVDKLNLSMLLKPNFILK